MSTLTIGNGITNIPNNAFMKSFSLTSVTIPNNITTIGEAAFYESILLQNVYIGQSVNTIGSLAFGYCSSLKNMIFKGLPSTITTVSSNIFLAISVNNTRTFTFYASNASEVNQTLLNQVKDIVTNKTVSKNGPQIFLGTYTTITSPSVLNKLYGDVFPLDVSSNSPAPFTYFSNNTNIATVNSSGVVTLIGTGSVTITVSQNLISGHNEASVDITINVATRITTIVVPSTISKSYFQNPFNLNASSNSPAPFTYYIVDTYIATIDSSGVITPLSVGTTTITVSQNAIPGYTDASVNTTISVTEKQLTMINVPTSISKTYGDAPFYLDASSNSSAPFIYESSDDSVATVNCCGIVTFVSNGTAIITTRQDISPEYTEDSKDTFVDVSLNTIENQVIIDEGKELVYFLTTNAKYATIVDNITVSKNLVNSGNNHKQHVNGTQNSICITNNNIPTDEYSCSCD
jgi:hypothetical protein